MARDDLAVNREGRVANWTIPDFVVAFALPDEMAARVAENAPNIA